MDAESGPIRAVDGVSFRIERGETLAVAGESGSGKPVTSLALMGLLPRGGRIAGGHIHSDGEDLGKLSPDRKRRMRGTEIGMIFQEPMTSFNPVLTVGEQITERASARTLGFRRPLHGRRRSVHLRWCGARWIGREHAPHVCWF